jgi:hypothetical protein
VPGLSASVSRIVISHLDSPAILPSPHGSNTMSTVVARRVSCKSLPDRPDRSWSTTFKNSEPGDRFLWYFQRSSAMKTAVCGFGPAL